MAGGAVAGLVVQADSTLAQDARATLRVTEADRAEHTLGVRQPVWASRLELTLNGQALAGVAQAGTVEVRRRWQSGDQLTVHYVLRTRLRPHPEDASRVAILRGPWFLGVNVQNAPTYFDEPPENARVLLPALDVAGDLPLKSAVDVVAGPVRFAAPAAYLALPYRPGGYPIQPQTVLLRPIAEHTAVADATRWALWFRPEARAVNPQAQR